MIVYDICFKDEGTDKEVVLGTSKESKAAMWMKGAMDMSWATDETEDKPNRTFYVQEREAEVYVVHYRGRGTPEANEVEKVFVTQESMDKYIHEECFDCGETKEEIDKIMEERDYLYTRTYEINE